MKNEKIIFVSTHENVNFEKKYQSHFSSEKRPGRSSVEITLLADLQCVEVKNENDRVIIPLVNIAFLKLESKISKEKAEADKKEAAKPKNNPKLNPIKKPK